MRQTGVLLFFAFPKALSIVSSVNEERKCEKELKAIRKKGIESMQRVLEGIIWRFLNISCERAKCDATLFRELEAAAEKSV